MKYFRNMMIKVMKLKKYGILSISCFFGCTILSGQLVINELMSSNSNTLYDEFGDTPDWIEIYNGNNEINLSGFGLSDDPDDPFKWIFPDITIGQNDFILLFASGNESDFFVNHWETVINWGDDWKYFIGNTPPPTNWNGINFNDSNWSIGPSGFGYGDGDDNTIVPSVMSVYVRNSFFVDTIDDIIKVVLHVDYDDAFVAYINGNEIARSNIGIPGIEPDYNDGANEWREAEIYTGGFPEKFDVEFDDGLLTEGENILSIQVHNFNQTSSDMSLIPFLTLGTGSVPDNPQGTPDILDFPLSNLHTSFRIDSDGEPLLLTNPDGETLDVVDSIYLAPDFSYGRQPDGSDNWHYFSEPTPKESNYTDGFSGFCGVTELSHSEGFYNNPIELSISTDSGIQQIYYTLDGSVPTENSNLYQNPILITETTVVRAAVIQAECPPGEITTKTYLINEQFELPIISVTTDPYNLWDDEYGIYATGNNASIEFPYFGANFWEDWERPVHVEFFEMSGDLGFSLNAGVKIFGNYSRGYPQKSLAIYARASYGSNQIDYQIFPDKDIYSFKSIVLRNSGNDWLGAGQFNTSMFRDGLNTGLMDNTGLDHQAFRPAVLFLNGEYWGIQNIREKVNEEFLASNHPGVDPDELDELEFNGEIIEGDNQDYLELYNFIENNDLSIEQNFQLVADEIDIENFIDYYLIQIYMGNTDWPGNNIKFWRPHIEGSKWKWILYDTDFGFGLFWWASTVYHNTLLFALDDNGPAWPNPPWSTLMFRKLMENSDFQTTFINRFCYYINTRFSPEYVDQQINNKIDQINTEIPNHLNRWGGSLNTWNQAVNDILDFGAQRRDIFFNHVSSYFNLNGSSNLTLSVFPATSGEITIAGLTPSDFPWEAEYFNQIPIDLKAIASPGYRFSHWEGVISENPDLTINLNTNLNITAVFTESSAEIFVNEFMAINDSIIMDESGDFDDWIELYNPNEIHENIGGLYLTDNEDNLTKWMIPNGTYIEPDSFKIIWADEEQEQGELHTNFKLNGDGETIFLVHFDGESIIDSISYNAQSSNISFGRLPDGNAEWRFFNDPTPGESNSSSDGLLLGDLNLDDLINVVDIILLVNTILDDNYNILGDMNYDSQINILDVVQLVNIILGVPEESDADYAETWEMDGTFYLSGNGYIGAVYLQLEHGDSFDFAFLASAMINEYRTKENVTSMIIVNPQSNKLFSSNDPYMVKTIHAANSIDYIHVNTPTNFSLNPAYPNPFNSSTQIEFTIPIKTHVNLKIFDILGREIELITNQQYEPGIHQINWNADHVSSGVYFIKMKAAEFSKAQKIVLVK